MSRTSERPTDLSGIVGKHVIYTYNNGWEYEAYYKNENKIDYRVISGKVGGRWVKDQQICMKQLSKGERRYQISWTEPTGTCVSQLMDIDKRELHTCIFFPQWVNQEPSKTVCFQNENLERMRAYRDAGPVYPIDMLSLSARINLIEDCGPDNEQVIC